MRRFALTMALSMLVMALTAAPVCGSTLQATMTPADVVDIARARNGSVIAVEGEAVGERLRAHGGRYWVNVLGGGSAIGVWVPEELSEVVTVFGDYRMDGDVVRVTGVVNTACETHDGEFDIHAESIAVVYSGTARENPVHPWKGAAGAGGLTAAFILWRQYRQRRDRRML